MQLREKCPYTNTDQNNSEYGHFLCSVQLANFGSELERLDFNIEYRAIPSQLWQMRCPRFQNLEIYKLINYVLKDFFLQLEPLSGKKIHSSRTRNEFVDINIVIKNNYQNPN